MEVIQMSDRTDQIIEDGQKKGFDDFVKICIYTNRKEFDALLNIRPMDYKMFKRLAELLVEIDANETFCRMFEKYSNYAEKYMAEIKEEISGVILPEFTREEEEQRRERLSKKIQEECNKKEYP